MLRERFAGRIVNPELRGGQPIWFLGRQPSRKEVCVSISGCQGKSRCWASSEPRGDGKCS